MGGNKFVGSSENFQMNPSVCFSYPILVKIVVTGF